MMVVMRELSFNLDGSVSSMGLPVNGTRIRLYDYWHRNGLLVKHFLCEQTTNKQGTYSFNVRKGIYCVEVLPNENTRFGRQSAEAIRITGNKNLNITLKAGCVLTGTVRDNTASPINDAEILVFGIEPHVLKTTQLLDDEGKFNLSLPAGKYYLALRYFEKEHPKGKRKKATPFLCPLFEVVDLKKDMNHDITLPPLISFKGKVSDAAGHPLINVQAVVTNTDKPTNIFTKEVAVDVSSTTKIDGSFEVLVQQGTYSVRLLPPDDAHLAEKTVSAIFVDNDRQRNYALEAGHGLKGKVTYNGSPVPNATVNAIGVNLDAVALCNEEGEFSFALPGGSYEIVVAAQPDSLGTVSAMELAPSRSTLILDRDTEHNVEMEGGVLVTGIVQDANKEACPGVQLSLYATVNGEFNEQAARRRPLWVGITGDDGHYEFRLMPESYWLVLNNQASTGHLVDVSPSKQKSDLTISGICLVNFEVLSESDEPIPNCQVCVQPYENARGYQNEQTEATNEIFLPIFTANNGCCTLPLPQGIYSVYFHPPEHSSFNTRQIKQLSVGTDMTRKVRLESKAQEVST